MNTWRRSYFLDEPSCRTSMKNSGNKKDDEDERKKKLKTQGEALQ